MSVFVMLDNGRGYEFPDDTPLTRAELEDAALTADRARRRGGKWAEFILRGGVPDTEQDAAVVEWWRIENSTRFPGVAMPTRRLNRADRYRRQQFVRARLGLPNVSQDVFEGRA